MRYFGYAFVALLLGSCATNKLHFADFTESSTIAALTATRFRVNVSEVNEIEPCKPCSEGSKAVWHAANKDVVLYEGFFPIPIERWKDFVSDAVSDTDAVDSKKSVKIELKRVFLKTLQNPRYIACQVELQILDGESIRNGVGVIKIRDTGQILLGRDRVRLDPQYSQVIRLAIRAAYANAALQ